MTQLDSLPLRNNTIDYIALHTNVMTRHVIVIMSGIVPGNILPKKPVPALPCTKPVRHSYFLIIFQCLRLVILNVWAGYSEVAIHAVLLISIIIQFYQTMHFYFKRISETAKNVGLSTRPPLESRNDTSAVNRL